MGEDIFARLILGHFAGDYLLQNKAMMLNKSKPGFHGIFWCTLHCLVYTAVVCLFLWTINPLVAIAVFISHWPIDRWSLASKWMKLIRSREPGVLYFVKEADAAFYCIVYVAIDNTMHILLMWLAIKWLV